MAVGALAANNSFCKAATRSSRSLTYLQSQRLHLSQIGRGKNTSWKWHGRPDPHSDTLHLPERNLSKQVDAGHISACAVYTVGRLSRCSASRLCAIAYDLSCQSGRVGAEPSAMACMQKGALQPVTKESRSVLDLRSFRRNWVRRYQRIRCSLAVLLGTSGGHITVGRLRS